MAEWSKAAVLKTVEGNTLRGFESYSLRHKIASQIKLLHNFIYPPQLALRPDLIFFIFYD